MAASSSFAPVAKRLVVRNLPFNMTEVGFWSLIPPAAVAQSLTLISFFPGSAPPATSSDGATTSSAKPAVAFVRAPTAAARNAMLAVFDGKFMIAEGDTARIVAPQSTEGSVARTCQAFSAIAVEHAPLQHESLVVRRDADDGHRASAAAAVESAATAPHLVEGGGEPGSIFADPDYLEFVAIMEAEKERLAAGGGATGASGPAVVPPAERLRLWLAKGVDSDAMPGLSVVDGHTQTKLVHELVDHWYHGRKMGWMLEQERVARLSSRQQSKRLLQTAKVAFHSAPLSKGGASRKAAGGGGSQRDVSAQGKRRGTAASKTEVNPKRPTKGKRGGGELPAGSSELPVPRSKHTAAATHRNPSKTARRGTAGDAAAYSLETSGRAPPSGKPSKRKAAAASGSQPPSKQGYVDPVDSGVSVAATDRAAPRKRGGRREREKRERREQQQAVATAAGLPPSPHVSASGGPNSTVSPSSTRVPPTNKPSKRREKASKRTPKAGPAEGGLAPAETVRGGQKLAIRTPSDSGATASVSTSLAGNGGGGDAATPPKPRNTFTVSHTRTILRRSGGGQTGDPSTAPAPPS